MSIAGTWQNEYGSIMELQVNGNTVTGFYQSSTGSVGKYEVVGVQLGADPTQALGQPVALAIEWHSVDDDPPDPSWNWSSGLSGQISIQNGEELLVLAHLLIVSSDFPGLAVIGNYIDKLTYRRIKRDVNQAPLRDDSHAPRAEDPLTGAWVSDDGITMMIKVSPETQGRFGLILGTIFLPSGPVEITGFTDINATADGLAFQSVAITAADPHNSLAISLSGTLDLLTGVLDLLEMQSAATAPANSYTQTRMSSTRFARQ